MDKGKNGSNKIKVLFAIPRGGFTLTEAVDNQMDMSFHHGKLQECGKFQIYTATLGRFFVPKAREEFAQYAIELDCDYLFMVDDDMICPPNLFELLYKHDKDIVAPLAFQRREPYFPVIYKHTEGWDEVSKQRYFANEIVKGYPKDTLFKCDAVGFGAVLIKRWVLEKMPQPRFMSTAATGEDILFCYHAREALGANIYCDTSVKIQHLGAPKIIGEQEFEEANSMDEMRKTYGEHIPKEQGTKYGIK